MPMVRAHAAVLVDDPRVVAQRVAFSRAARVAVNAAAGGLGDSFLQLKPAFAAARHNPDKAFTIVVHPALLSFVEAVKTPANVTLVAELDVVSLERTPSFVLSYMLAYPADVAWMNWMARSDWTPPPDVTRAIVRRLAAAQGVSSAFDLCHRGTAPVACKLADYVTALQNTLLGIPVDDDDLRRPVLARPRPAERRWDVLIAPDAFTFRTAAGDRSRKSLSVERWREVFSLLQRDLRVGIVTGTAHVQYSASVAASAAELLPYADKVEVDLLGLIDAISGTRVYVGADTATTHIASDHASASDVIVRMLFNEAAASLRVYGIGGRGERAPILSLSPAGVPHVSPWSDALDLSSIPADIVARFIGTGDVA